MYNDQTIKCTFAFDESLAATKGMIFHRNSIINTFKHLKVNRWHIPQNSILYFEFLILIIIIILCLFIRDKTIIGSFEHPY